MERRFLLRCTLPFPQPQPQPQYYTSPRDSRIGYGSSSNSNNMQRSTSSASHRSDVIANDGASGHQISLSRGNTLKKKQSLRRSGSLKRSSSRRSMKAGSVRSLALQSTSETDEQRSAFFCPVPTSGNPTEILANRFQGELRTPLFSQIYLCWTRAGLLTSYLRQHGENC